MARVTGPQSATPVPQEATALARQLARAHNQYIEFVQEHYKLKPHEALAQADDQ